MKSTLTAKTESSIVLLSLLESVVLGFYGYYIGEVVLATIPFRRLSNKTSPGQGSNYDLTLEFRLILGNFDV
ncbi:hypothetical protein A6770_12255 [Nostoc minutum NIES-26]|uniref:Uncharacterized protein n=1 Tax=Nostoc minutum NIES-26 TaxID=1844469 RepID=A0A367RRK4_9NOSO|nr:hypothetical protein [Dendronalium sp. ChiSLP03b]MDZ8204665.1 hypothetical protein [Dendronalium sp. ChiSLP03b]RCJ39206.1 hypothetical protein A6770_12255 [Nostoc minutum NIES-26]